MDPFKPYQDDRLPVGPLPVEHRLLIMYPFRREACPNCTKPFPEYHRGIVQSGWRKRLGLAYCACICHHCYQIIGWERPVRDTDNLSRQAYPEPRFRNWLRWLFRKA